MTNLAALLGDQALVDLVLGWRTSAYRRLCREGLPHETAIAGANAEALKWAEEITGGTFSHFETARGWERIRPTRQYFPPFRPPAPAATQRQLTLTGGHHDH